MKTRNPLVAIFLFVSLHSVLADQPVLFDLKGWPPGDGMFIGVQTVLFPNGIVLSNFTSRASSASVVLPSRGETAVATFTSLGNFQLSLNGGLTFSAVQASVDSAMRISNQSGGRGSFTYDTEMLQLNLAGATMPGGLLFRESPTKASAGQVQTSVTSNGDLVSAFFDVFWEASSDGGQTWTSAIDSSRIELRADPMAQSSELVPTPLLPPPCCAYTNAGAFLASFPNGFILKEAKLHAFTLPQPAPGTNGTQVYNSTPQLDFQFSSNNGSTFSQGRVQASLAFVARYRMNAGDTQFFDTEILSLTVQGGDLPAGILMRESPTIASVGGLTLTTTGGVYQVQSFFDLWTELSVDGGQTWTPTAAPSRLLLECPGAEIFFASSDTPPTAGRYASSGQFWASYAPGIVLRNLVIHSPTQSFPPPAILGSAIQTFGARTDFQWSTDGGQSFSPGSAPANLSVRVQSSVENGNTRYFDTEILQLDLSGGSLPPGVLIRESPTRASLGCLSERTVSQGFWISEAFGIFTEISLDGGQTWAPSIGAPGEIILGPPLPVLSIHRVQDGVAITWPAAAEGFHLLQRANLSSQTAWSPVGIPPFLDGDQWTVKLAAPIGTAFFELTSP